MAKVIIPGLGEFDPEEILQVHYRGSTQSTVTRVGRGTIYKYSSKPEATYPPDFIIFARDAHLFSGPFDIRPMQIKRISYIAKDLQQGQVIHLDEEDLNVKNIKIKDGYVAIHFAGRSQSVTIAENDLIYAGMPDGFVDEYIISVLNDRR